MLIHIIVHSGSELHRSLVCEFIASCEIVLIVVTIMALWVAKLQSMYLAVGLLLALVSGMTSEYSNASRLSDCS